MDPLSGAASVVGIVSLGLQVCQGIMQYYGHWKDYTLDIASTYEMVEQLRGIFEVLSTILNSSPLDNGPAVEQVRSSIKKCEGGTLLLRKRLEKIKAKDANEEKPTLTIKQKLEGQGRRLIYPFQQGTLGKIRDAVSELRDNLTPALHALNIDRSGTILQELRGFRAEQQRWHLEEKNKKVLNWLSPLDFIDRQNANLSSRHHNSGSWFLEHDDFKSWQNGVTDAPAGLWCYGGMGSGKSVMMSMVINHLQRLFIQDNVALAYVYCDWQDSKAQTPTHLIGSLLKQLVEGTDNMPSNVLERYTKHKNGKTPLTLDECMALIRKIASQFRRVILFIDGLDELAYSQNESDNSRMLVVEGALNNLLATQAKPIHDLQIFVTSRFNQQLKTANFTNIQISVAKRDLVDFFRYALKDGTYGSPWTNPDLAKKVQNDPLLFDSIVERCIASADDMFLLACMHLDHVKRQVNMRQLQKAMNELPNQLPDTIDAALHRLQSQSPMLREIGTSVLLWVTHALRPLRIEELQHALAIEPGDVTFLDDGITPQNILISSCAGLVTLENESGIIRLINFCIKEYLDENPLEWPFSPHLTITKTCTSYLILDNFEAGSDIEGSIMSSFFTEYPFLAYAAEHWGSHAHLNEESESPDLVLTLLLNDEKAGFSFRALYHAIWGDARSCPTNINGLHLAAFFDLDVQLRRLIEIRKNVDSPDSWNRTALYIAASTSHDMIAKTLIDAGANVTGRVIKGRERWDETKLWYYPPWARDDRRGEALEAAAEAGHEKTVSLLLHNKANIDYTGGVHNSPLEAAVFGGYGNIVKILLREGATVEKSTLQASVYNGDVEILRALIDQLPEPELKPARKPWNYPYSFEPTTSKNLPDALYAAALANRLSCAKLLFEYHVDADAEINGFYRTPLQAAASYGHIDMIKLLLEYGANVNSISGEWINAYDKPAHYVLFNPHLCEAALNVGLEELARRNHSQFLPRPKKVLAEKPDLEGYSMSEDEMAAYKASMIPTEVLSEEPSSPTSSTSSEVLVEKSLNIARAPISSDPEYRSAFWKDLLQDQVDSSRISGRHGSALQAASHAGLIEVVILLLERGADVNAYAGYFGTALQAAAAAGKRDIVTLLLQRGARVNTLSGHFGNPLHAAASSGHKEIVRTLLLAGARVNARGGQYGYPLQSAARSADIDTVKLLLDAGASVNALGGHFGDALQAATMGLPASALVTAVADFETSDIVEKRHELADYFQFQRNNYARYQMRVRGVFGKMLQNAAGGAFGNSQEVFMNDEDKAKLLFLNASAECKSNLDIVKLLLDAGADPNAHGGNFYSAIHAAAYAGRLDVVQLLLESGADINAQPDKSFSKFENPYGDERATALENAILMGHTMVANYLVNNGADPNSKSSSRQITPLHLAAATGNTKTVRLLLKAGADVNSGDLETPLDEALKSKPEIVTNSYTSYFTPEEKDVLGVVTLLIDGGADGTSRNRALRNALGDLQYLPANRNIIPKILESGVDVNSGEDFDPKKINSFYYPSWKQKPLLLLIDQGSEDIEIYRMILNAGVSIETEGKSILWFAVRRNLKDAVKFFLNNGFRIHDEIFEEAISKIGDEDGHDLRNGVHWCLEEEEEKASIEKWLKNQKEVLSLLQAARSQYNTT